jgi:hypothetical protein
MGSPMQRNWRRSRLSPVKNRRQDEYALDGLGRGIVGIEREFSPPSFSRLSGDEPVAGRDGMTPSVRDLLLQRAPLNATAIL